MKANRRYAASAGAVCILASLVCSRDVYAQAWVPARGEGTAAVSFQDLDVTRHLASTKRVNGGHINSVVLLSDVTYGLTDKVAIDVALPFVSSKYRGPYPHANTTIDDGTFHSSFTDVRMSVRYNVTRKGTVLTPFIGAIVPSHDYPFYGHAAAGERLHELQVGAYAAKLFTAGVPGLFVSGRLGYGFVERVLNISHNRSMGDLEVGYFVGPAFRVFATTAGQYTHGGIDFPVGGLPAVPLQYRPVHDIIQRVHYVHAGGGFAYSVTDSVDVFASFSRLVVGRNGHALNSGITMGASWSFSGRSKRDAVAAGAGAPSSEYAQMVAKRQGSLGRCICQKSGT
ncbi:MAG: hypothetical protein V7647_2639 [Acidobacteriota bacterium]|jgi:hypothetical protein